ncbi:MAG: alpha/beta fold hydrolase [Pseudomonadota bacterium]
MTPFFFGTGTRRLFGAYSPARNATPGGTYVAAQAAVVCPPWGQEHLRAHRSLHRLASELAEVGFHVLRFDYYGTGDSAGDMPDADLDGWRSDIVTAIEELKDTAGVKQVALIGLRLGATLAAAVAAQRKDVSALVLWDPLSSGTQQELLGFTPTAAMSAQLAVLRLPSIQLPPRTLAIASKRAATDLLPDGLTPEIIEAPPAWVEEQGLGAGAVPARLLRRIVEWLQV